MIQGPQITTKMSAIMQKKHKTRPVKQRKPYISPVTRAELTEQFLMLLK
jgi:hypothetical protein